MRAVRRGRAHPIAIERLRRQRLAGNVLRRPADVVRWLGAVQAQEYEPAKWAIGQRCAPTTSAAVDRAIAEGSIVRTHVMRPTWHFVAARDIRWLLALTAPRVEAISATYYRKLDLDAATRRKSNAIIARALEGGRRMTRRALAEALRRRGIPTDTMRLGFLLGHAELAGLISSGPRAGAQHTYALLDERVPAAPPLARDDALGRLATRYFTSHGPATPHDFSWWSGLTVSDARRAIEIAGRALAPVSSDGTTYWTGERDAAAGRNPPAALLLPIYDEFLIAYRDRSAAFEPVVQAAFKADPEALMRHFLVVAGSIVGGWRQERATDGVVIRPRTLRTVAPAERRALAAAAERYSAFIGVPVRIAW